MTPSDPAAPSGMNTCSHDMRTDPVRDPHDPTPAELAAVRAARDHASATDDLDLWLDHHRSLAVCRVCGAASGVACSHLRHRRAVVHLALDALSDLAESDALAWEAARV